MVDTETIEIVFQFMETFLPPGEIIFLHRIPIIGRKHPVLTVHGKVIGRSTGLSVHIEILRLHPCLNACTAHTDRQIAFQHNPVLTGIIGNSFKLGMQDVLQKIKERDFRIGLVCFRTKLADTTLIIYGIFFPLREVGSAILVTQIAVCSIGHQPG